MRDEDIEGVGVSLPDILKELAASHDLTFRNKQRTSTIRWGIMKHTTETLGGRMRKGFSKLGRPKHLSRALPSAQGEPTARAGPSVPATPVSQARALSELCSARIPCKELYESCSNSQYELRPLFTHLPKANRPLHLFP